MDSLQPILRLFWLHYKRLIELSEFETNNDNLLAPKNLFGYLNEAVQKQLATNSCSTWCCPIFKTQVDPKFGWWLWQKGSKRMLNDDWVEGSIPCSHLFSMIPISFPHGPGSLSEAFCLRFQGRAISTELNWTELTRTCHSKVGLVPVQYYNSLREKKTALALVVISGLLVYWTTVPSWHLTLWILKQLIL